MACPLDVRIVYHKSRFCVNGTLVLVLLLLQNVGKGDPRVEGHRDEPGKIGNVIVSSKIPNLDAKNLLIGCRFHRPDLVVEGAKHVNPPVAHG